MRHTQSGGRVYELAPVEPYKVSIVYVEAGAMTINGRTYEAGSLNTGTFKVIVENNYSQEKIITPRDEATSIIAYDAPPEMEREISMYAASIQYYGIPLLNGLTITSWQITSSFAPYNVGALASASYVHYLTGEVEPLNLISNRFESAADMSLPGGQIIFSRPVTFIPHPLDKIAYTYA